MVHDSRTAIGLLFLSVAAALAFNQTMIESFLTRLWVPVPLALLVPALTATAVGVGAGSGASSLEGRPPQRLVIARGAWVAVLFLAAAAISVLAGGWSNLGIQLRNALVFSALSLAASALASTSWTWLPPTVFALTALLFGQAQDGIRFWAFIIDQQTDRGELSGSILAFGAALLLYMFRGAKIPS
jgi:hypothetical protein